jgi:serine/threonine protein kinase
LQEVMQELEVVQRKLEVVQRELEVVQGELEELKGDAAIGDLLTRLDKTKKEADAELHKSEAALQQSEAALQELQVVPFYGCFNLGKGKNKAQAIYESATCVVIFAILYTEGAEVEVALKFMHKREHLRAELDARGGGARFDRDFVLAARGYHDAPGFQIAAAEYDRKPPLPGFCLVLERGGRNLAEAVLAEMIAGDLDRLRPIFQQLAACLQHMHRKGYVHCDFKMKNAIRNAANGLWQLIDMDAATAIGLLLGAKFSSAVCPPEMVIMLDGRPVLRAMQNFTAGLLKKEDVLTADPSFDVWSLGTVMFELVVERPLFSGVDSQENLDPREWRCSQSGTSSRWKKDCSWSSTHMPMTCSARCCSPTPRTGCHFKPCSNTHYWTWKSLNPCKQTRLQTLYRRRRWLSWPGLIGCKSNSAT